MDIRLRKCLWIIHLFALAHGVAVLLFAMAGYSDEIILSLLTITMIMWITHIYGMPLEVSAAIAALCCFAGFYLGTTGGDALNASDIPLLVKYANAITTFAVTELMGWTTVLVSKRR